MAEEDKGYIFETSPEPVDVEQEAAKAAESGFDPEKLAEALIKIGEVMIGVKLYSYQRDPAFRIIYSMLVGDGAEVTMLFSRQSGKSEIVTFCINVIGILFPVLGKIFPELSHFKDGVKMGLFAPQLDQVETVYQRAMERLLCENTKKFMQDPDIGDQALSKVNWKIKSGSFLKAQSGAKQSKIESKTYHIVFIDESQDMDTKKVRKSIIPMTAATFGTIVRLGTPNAQRGDFYHTISNNKRHDKELGTKVKKTKRLHYEYNYLDVAKAKKQQYKQDGKKFHTLYAKAVERDKASMGFYSDEFQMSYCLKWMLDIGMFISEEDLNRTVYDKRMNFPEIEDDSFVVAGLDIASARASTVLTLGIVDNPAIELDDRPKKTLAGWVEFSNLDYEAQFNALADALIENKVKVLFFDNTGVGRVLGDRIIYHFGEVINIVPYTFTPQSKSDMWKALDEDIHGNRLKVPAHHLVTEKREFKNFDEQMLHLQKLWKGNIMVCEKVQGYKDDYCDSLALMNLAGNYLYQPLSTFEVSEENLLISHNAGHSLKDKSSW